MWLALTSITALLHQSVSFSFAPHAPTPPQYSRAHVNTCLFPCAERKHGLALSALRATASTNTQASSMPTDTGSPLSATSETPAANNHARPRLTAKQKQQQQQAEATRSLQALRALRAQKLAAGETVFFDFPSSIGGPDCSPEGATKPLFLYLTGMDGVGISGEPQFEDLSTRFEVRRLQVLAEDRRTFDELVQFVVDYVADWQARSKARYGKVVVLGESFGGLLACGVALANPTHLQGLVLANPATSFDRSNWPALAPLLASIPARLPLADTRLTDLVRNAPGAEQLLKALPLKVPDKSVGEVAYAAIAGGALFVRALDEKLATTLASLAAQQGSEVWAAAQQGELTTKLERLSTDSAGLLDSLLETMPAATVAHRIEQCLALGVKRVEGKLQNITLPVVVLAGKDDNILPSAAEAARLAKLLPQCSTIVVRAQGHLILGASQNLTRILLDSTLLPPKMRRDWVDDFVPPSGEELAQGVASLEGFRQFFSPVFFSTDPVTGRVVRGLSGVPAQIQGRPMLFVGNHQTLSLDLGLLVSQVYEEKGILMRGLAHPVLFRGQAGRGGVPGAYPQRAQEREGETGEVLGGVEERSFFEKFGAVPVSARNAAKLMRRGDAVLLFPGGVKETIPASPDDKYSLMWPEKNEFVRLAAKYNATIVPFGAIGAAEALSVVATVDEIASFRASPLGQLLAQGARGAAGDGGGASEFANQKFGGPGGVDPERLRFPESPLAVPAPLWAMSRLYFHFGTPVTPHELALTSDEAADATYSQVKGEVEESISYLLRKRSTDEFRDLLPRLAYERINSKQAPTFEP